MNSMKIKVYWRKNFTTSYANTPWYYEMKYYLTHGSSPQYMEPKKKRSLRLKSTQYHLTQGILFKNNYDGVFLRCLEKDDAQKVLSELHDGLARGHFGGDTKTQNPQGRLLLAYFIHIFTCICKKM
jgi:hypothetical protein